MNKKLNLPKYAWKYEHPAAKLGDVGAQFYDDERHGTICVYLEKHDCGMIGLNLDRGGLSDCLFTPAELAKVTELLPILARAAGVKVPCPVNPSLDEALNSGDGTYKP